MKACIISSQFYPTPAGLPITLFEVMKNLNKLNLSLKIVSFYPIPENFNDHKKYVLIDGLENFRFPSISKKRSFFKYILINYFYTFFKLTNLIKKSDIIHLWSLSSLTTIGAFLSILLKKPFIITMVGGEIWEFYDEYLTIQSKMSGNLKFLLENATVITSYSKFFKDKAIAVGAPPNIYTIYTGIPERKFQATTSMDKRELRKKHNLGEKDFIILVVQGLGDSPKGRSVKNIILSIKRIINEIPNPKLVILGDGSYKSKLIKLVKEEKLTNYVIFKGYVPYDIIQEFYSISDIFILVTPRECLPNVVFEAMAAGLPIITTNTGGQIEIVEENVNGFVFDFPPSIEGIAKKILYLFKNPDVLEKIRINNIEKIKNNFLYEKTSPKYFYHYKNAIKNSLSKEQKYPNFIKIIKYIISRFISRIRMIMK